MLCGSTIGRVEQRRQRPVRRLVLRRAVDLAVELAAPRVLGLRFLDLRRGTVAPGDVMKRFGLKTRDACSGMAYLSRVNWGHLARP